MSNKDDSLFSTLTQKQTLDSITVSRGGGGTGQSLKRKSLQQSNRNEFNLFSRSSANQKGCFVGTVNSIAASVCVNDKALKDESCLTTSAGSSSTPPSTSLQLQIDDIFINSIKLHSNNNEILNYDIVSQDSYTSNDCRNDEGPIPPDNSVNNLNVIYKNNRKHQGSEIHIYLSRQMQGKKINCDLHCGGGVSNKKLKLWKCLHPLRLREKKNKKICGFYSPPSTIATREWNHQLPQFEQIDEPYSSVHQPPQQNNVNLDVGSCRMCNMSNLKGLEENSIKCDHYNENLIKNFNANCKINNNNNNCNINVDNVNVNVNVNDNDDDNSIRNLDLYTREDELEAYMREIKQRENS